MEQLDEHLLRQRVVNERCRRMRFITLMFTGLMASAYLVFNLMHWPGGRILLFIGLAAISIQSIACFFNMPTKTWTAGIRALLTLLATLYIGRLLFAV